MIDIIDALDRACRQWNGARVRAVLVLVAATALGAPAWAQGGGIVLYENGAPDMGASYAGASARAQDAGTVFSNPAGMTRIDENQLVVGSFGLFIDSEFDLDTGKSTTVPSGQTNDGGDLGSFVPGIGSFAVLSLSEDWKFGFSLSALAAAGVDYDSQWVGRTFVTENDLIIASLQPSVAYRFNEQFSLGVGLNIAYGNLNQELKATSAPNAPTIKFDDADDWAIGGTIGVLFELSESTRIGVNYRSELSFNLSGDTESPLPQTVDFDSDFDLPQGFNVGLYHDLNDQWALLADAGWTNWGDFDYQPVEIAGFSAAIPRDWDDTWRVGLGVQYKMTETWLLRSGFSFDSSPIDDDKRLPDIPAGDQYRFSAGVQHDFGGGKYFGLNYTLLYSPMDVDQVALPGGVVLDGEYDPNMLHFLGVNLTINF